MKKRFMILPPFLVIFTIYGALTDVSAATEGTTGTTETTLQEPILYELPPGIPLPETVMEANDTNTPTTTTTESPPAEVTAVDEQMTETPAPPTEQPLPETADLQPTTETIPPATMPIEEAINPTTPTTEAPAPDSTETIPPVTPIVELPTEQPAAETEKSIVTEQPVVNPTVLTVPIEVIEEPAPFEATETTEEAISDVAFEEPMQMMAAAVVSDFSGTSQIINSVNISDNVIALTFDDGHSYGNLYEILDNLNYLGVKATFFMNGDADASLLQQIVADGHQLANHSYSHGDSTTLSSSALANDINLMEDYIQTTTGTSSLPFFRLPYGSYNSSVLDTVGSLGYQYTIGWDVDTLDWTGISATEVSNAVVNNVRPGSIVLMHASVGAANTPESLWYSIAALKQAGYGFSTVSDLLSLGGYFAVEETAPIEEDYSDDILSEVINQVATSEKTISLTISDASDAENVREILANLASTNVKATFFLNGLTDPTVINEIIQQGHEIGNHTYTHDDATAMSVDEVVWELNAMETLVQDSTGGATTRPYFRAPMGATNDAVLATAASMGYMYTIGWTVDTRDWSGTLTAAQVSSAVVNNLAPGAIFLMHGNASASTTPAALLQMITAIRQLGYNFATISGLLALEGSYPITPGEEPSVTDPDPEPPVTTLPGEQETDPDPQTPISTSPAELINQINTDEPVISLTISDASGTENVRQILNNLALLGIKATFFLNGMTDPSLIDDIIAQGHEIGNHTFSHEDATQMTTAQLTTGLDNLEQLVQGASGTSTTPYFRAPMGETNATVLATAGSLGYQYAIGWTISTSDWSGTQTAAQISSAVVNSIAPGAILLLHGSADAVATPAAILQMAAAVQALGYRFETITGLLAYQDIYTGEVPVVVEPDNGETDYGTGPSRYVDHVDTGRNVIALTFDDGDDYTNLHDILYNLNSLGAKATFFLNGTTDPGLMAEIVASGHQLANHTYSHNDDSTSLSADELAYDLALMEEYILDTTGVSSKPYFRAPAGVYNDAVLETLGSLGYAYTIGWTQDTRDWEGYSDTTIAASVTDYLDAGSIYLLHANPTAVGTPESLWYMIAEARSQGYEFVTVDELMALEGVYDDGSDGSSDVSDGVSQFIEQIDTNQKVISLTFDDLGDSEVLQGILDALAELDVKATFFADGTADPDMLYQVVSQGHELGNHSYSHEFSTYLTIEEFTADLNALENKIQDATGATSRPLFRPPYGDYDQSVLETLGSLGYTYTVGWSVDSLDYLGTLSSEEIAFNVLDQLAPGAIYLMHAVPESFSTPGSLYEIITSARELGYAFATISDLIQLDGVYSENPIDPETPVDPVDPVDPNPPVITIPSQLINQVNTNQQVISLTISDVSSAANLRQILANLALLDVKVTFFLNGLTDPTLIDDILAQGHEIGNHTFTQDDATQMTAAELTADLNQLEQLVKTATGESTTPYFRAPMGETNATVLATAGSLGYSYTIGWTTDTRDWSGTLSASQVSAAVLNNLSAGAIYLLHGNSSASTTPTALLEMITAARALGYQFTTISELLAYEGDYSYVEPEPEFVIPVLDDFGNITNPVITRNDVTDVYNPLGTADPFIILVDGVYHMFFEVLRDYNITTQSFTDSVAHAYSSDLVNWTYTQVVLGPETDGIRAAYPSVFEYNENYYMVPDQAGNVEAYFATSFPLGWDYHSTLLEGNFVDTNVFEVGGTWYLTTSEQPYNSISLYYNTSGDWRNDQWQLHPAGLIIEEDWTEKGYRGAGNPFVFEDYIVMPVQVTPVATNVYGEYTSWYKLSDLSPTTVTVEYLGEAVGAQDNGQWNDLAMHHIAHAPYGDGYVYVVDGLAYYASSTGQAEYTIGLYTEIS